MVPEMVVVMVQEEMAQVETEQEEMAQAEIIQMEMVIVQIEFITIKS